VERARLYINKIDSLDALIALEFGRVDDGQPGGRWQMVTGRFGYLMDGDRAVGFRIDDEDLEDLKTVRDAVDYVTAKLGVS